LIFYLAILCILLVLFLYLGAYLFTRRWITSPARIESFEYALVLGAGLEKNGQPSDILMDRIVSAMDLYSSHKVKHLIMSGSQRRNYDEAGAMQKTTLSHVIPESVMLIDRSGNSTFQSCLFVRSQLELSSVLIITQAFHLPRAILLQRFLGVKAYGVAADNFRFSLPKKAYWYFRELFALPYNLLKYLIYRIR
jgi:SanA protein